MNVRYPSSLWKRKALRAVIYDNLTERSFVAIARSCNQSPPQRLPTSRTLSVPIGNGNYMLVPTSRGKSSRGKLKELLKFVFFLAEMGKEREIVKKTQARQSRWQIPAFQHRLDRNMQEVRPC